MTISTEANSITERSQRNVANLAGEMWSAGFYVEAMLFRLFPPCRQGILKSLVQFLG